MIVPMKQLTLLVSKKEQQNAIKKMRELGILHIKHVQSPDSEEADLTKREIDRVEKARIILDAETTGKGSDQASGQELVNKILNLAAERDEKKSQYFEMQNLRQWFSEWGDVSYASVQKLEAAGCYFKFYKTDAAGLKKIPEEKSFQILKEEKGSINIALISDSPDDSLDLKEERMPQVEIADLNRDLAEAESQLASLQSRIDGLKAESGVLVAYKHALSKKLEFSQAIAGMGNAEQVAYLQGYCPEETVGDFKNTADSEGWGYIIQDPEDISDVPTLLKNNKALRIIEPLFQFMGTIPGYHETDVSFVFLLFFSVFYAMIIGDAGYGLVFLGLTAWLRSKNKKAPIEPFALFYVLSATTILWGFITGTWFGSRAIAEWAPLKRFIIEPMFSFNESDKATFFMMRLAFMIGLLHLIVAHLMAFVKTLPSLKAVAQVGWAFVCVGMFFVVDFLVLSNPMPSYAIPIFIGGFTLIGLFTNFQKNPLKMIGSFIGAILNSIQSSISAFSDIVSYIRLFAVGLAGVTVAASFNDMASGILAPIVLVLGHGLNIVLGLMSVMVHGVRLNMLEFSGHLGQEWTGKPYEPFKEA